MEVITLNQPDTWINKNTGEPILLENGLRKMTVEYPAPNRERKSIRNDVEQTLTEMKQAVVNSFLKQGFRAPQNEIAKYIAQDGYWKEYTTVDESAYPLYRSVSEYYEKSRYDATQFKTEKKWIPGPKLVMTRGK